MARVLRALSAASLLLLAVNRLPAQISFARTPPVLLPAGAFGSGAIAIAVADFNGDGIPDVAATEGGDLLVYPGNGDGTFRSPVTTPTGLGNSNPGAIIAGDFNNDGKQDAVVVSPATPLLFLGNGDGTFQPPLMIPAPSGSEFPVVGDFNGDKNLDLLLYDGFSTLYVLLGNGAGGFSQAAAIAASSAGGIAVGDLNKDHKLDMAVTSSSNDTVCIYLGNGDGTFGSPSPYTVGIGPGAVGIRDFNGDGEPDVAVADAGSNDVAVLLGNGDGTFQPPIVNPVPSSFQSDLGAMAIDDFNRDGNPDIAIIGYILLGAGNGTFPTAVPYSYVLLDIFAAASSVLAADLNGDHKPDLVIGTGDTVSTVTILLGKGNATFRGAPDTSVGTAPSSIAVADFNGDGIPDFVTASPSSNSLSVALGSGHGRFKAVTTVPLIFSPSLVVAGDINGDGNQDLVITGSPGSFQPLAILFGNGSGHFSAPLFVPGIGSITAIALGDVTNDGRLDIVVPGAVLIGNGDGTFQLKTVSGTGGALGLALGDFNGDGKLDIAAALGESFLILLGDGQGNFTPSTSFPVSVTYGAVSVAIADLNGDGALDLALGGVPGLLPGPLISIFLGYGNGTFQPERAASGALNVLGSLTAADFNLDGKTDLAMLTPNSVSILPGNGDGTFQAAQIFGVDSGPTAMAVAAFSTSNTKPCLLVTNSGSNTVSILDNTTP